jgi:hypothetical protein
MSFIHNKLFMLNNNKLNNNKNKKGKHNKHNKDNQYNQDNTDNQDNKEQYDTKITVTKVIKNNLKTINKIILPKNIDNYIDNNIDNNIFLIKKDNINLINDDFENINLVRIFGKGPTFQNIKKTNSSEFHIGINQTVNELTDCDMLVINDLHNIYLIKDEVIKNLKYILTPEYLHINGCYNVNGYFKKVYEYVKEKKFVGKYIVYNLGSNQNPNSEYITLSSRISSSNNATDFVCIFLNNFIKKIDFYGIGIYSTQNYNDKFIGNGNYKRDCLNRISNDIKRKCEKYKIKYTLN